MRNNRAMAEFGTFTRLTKALQYDGNNTADIIEYIGTTGDSTAERNTAGAIVNNVAAVNIGDYVVQTDTGFRVVTEAQFEEEYAPV